jgi:carbohydrate diacid regulator
MKLRREIGQRIMLLVSNNIHQGVSVADDTAQVLASTDPHLVGIHHPLAAQAIATGELTKQAQGQLAGVSLPLIYADHVVGGIVLDDVSAYSEDMIHVARTLAELIVYQAMVIEQLPQQKWVRDKFVADLLHGRLTGAPDVALQEADMLAIDLRVSRVVIVVDIPSAGHGRPERRVTQSSLPNVAHTLQIEQMHTRLLEQARRFITPYETDVYSFVDERLLILLATVTPPPADERRRRLAGEVQRFLDELAHVDGAAPSAGIGRYCAEWQTLPQSFADARCALETGARLHGAGHVFLIEALGLASFICSEDQQLKADLAQRVIQPLAAEPELFTTLDVFLQSNLSPSHTAERLHIHRHTLAYRLEKIARLTGLDPRQFEAATHLYAALVLWKSTVHPGTMIRTNGQKEAVAASTSWYTGPMTSPHSAAMLHSRPE